MKYWQQLLKLGQMLQILMVKILQIVFRIQVLVLILEISLLVGLMLMLLALSVGQT